MENNITNEARREVSSVFKGAALVAALKGVNDGVNEFWRYTAQFETEAEKRAYTQGHWSAKRRVDAWSEANGY